MPYTRRLLSGLVATTSLIWSCSAKDDDATTSDPTDAATDAARALEGNETSDAAFVVRGAGAFDAATLPIVCVSSSCATSLITKGAGYGWDGDSFCALLQDGTVACWGANDQGQLGRSGIPSSATPTRVPGVMDVVSLDRGCALDARGEAWCWGSGAFLQSSDAPSTVETLPVKLPIAPATKIAVGPEVGCALTNDGVSCWGSNVNGQVSASEPFSAYPPYGPHTIPIPEGAVVRDLVVDLAAFALREDGTAVSWGANPPLGRVSPIIPDPHPLPIDMSAISSLSLSVDNACATANGVGYCWGVLTPRRTGIPRKNTLDRALPEPVPTPEPVVQIATTNTLSTDDEVEPQRWCAVGSSGAVYCWGFNGSGQVGDGTKNYAVNPFRVSLPSTAAQVKTTIHTTCALLTTGKVYCWGNDFYGQLGNGKGKQEGFVPQEVRLP